MPPGVDQPDDLSGPGRVQAARDMVAPEADYSADTLRYFVQGYGPGIFTPLASSSSSMMRSYDSQLVVRW